MSSSLFTALGSATSGLSANQAAIDVISRNITNAKTEGYTKKVLPRENRVYGGVGQGVRTGEVQRNIDTHLQKEALKQTAVATTASTRLEYMERIDQLFGRPEDESSISARVKDLTIALQRLSDTPESSSIRETTLNAAANAAGELNQLSDSVQAMRLDAERAMATSVSTINDALDNVHRLNEAIASLHISGQSTADLEDQRDVYLGTLSEELGVRYVSGDNGKISVFTESGRALVDGSVNHIEFTPAETMTPLSDRGSDLVGKLILTSSNDDMLVRNEIRSGRLAGLVEMRDTILPQAQRQLDDLAHGLALSLSAENHTVNSTRTAAVIDYTNIGSGGDKVVFDYINSAGQSKQVVLTAGADFAIGATDNDTMTNLVTALTAASGGDLSATVPVPAGLGSLEQSISVVAGGQINTVRSFTLVGEQCQLFVDSANGQSLYADLSQSNYPVSVPPANQRKGFAARITVNPELLADNTQLVTYKYRVAGSTSLNAPGTADIGSDHRANALIERMSISSFTFDGATGIGGTSAAYNGTVEQFATNIVSFQAMQVADTQGKADYEVRFKETLEQKFEGSARVNMDDELSDLMAVQSAYQASAKLIQVVDEMLDTLMNMKR